MDWPADKVERRNVSELIPYVRNSRTHSEAQVSQIAASIREWGWTMPILCDEEGNVIAGHGRIMAAQKLGIVEAPCMTAVGWSEAKRRAYVVADNKLALNSEWDTEMLRIEMSELDDMGFDLELTGFDAGEISALQFDDDAEIDMPALADGDKPPFQDMTFNLHDDQVEQVKEAIAKAKSMGDFGDTGNENANANALTRICEIFNGLS